MVWTDVHKPSHFRVRWQFSALGRQIVLAVLLTSILFAILVSGVRIWVEHRQDSLRATALIEQAQQLLAPLTGAQRLDQRAGNAVLSRLVNLPSVRGAQIVFPDGTRQQVGLTGQDDGYLRAETNLPTAVADRPAHMVLVMHSPTLSKRILQKAKAHFLTEVTRVLIIGMIMLIIFDRIAARHLRAIAQQVRSTNWMESRARIPLERDVGVFPDEIDSIINALETMRCQSQNAYASVSRQAAEMRALNRSLKSANREQQELTYALSHDLIAPMNTIDMLLGEMGETRSLDADETQQMIADLHTSTRRMRHQIEAVQQFARLHQEELAFTAVNLDAILNHVLEQIADEIEAENATLSIVALGWVVGNRPALEHLFTQLLRNALRYRDPARPLSIRISTDSSNEGPKMTVLIKDTGMGIAPAYHDHVFGLFRRLHTHGDIPGHGMGLPLSKRIAELHGGSISLQSEPGVGTTLSITLPRSIN